MRVARVRMSLLAIFLTLLLPGRVPAGEPELPPGLCMVDAECNDQDPCTDDFCSPMIGCQATPTDCNDDDACTTDSCDAAGCQHAFLDCNDGNACTDDFCDSTRGCSVQDVDCDDHDPCTTDTCDPMQGCTHPSACDDQNPCTIASCDSVGGVCSYTDVTCDDHDACTADTCDQSTGCAYTKIICDDHNECTSDSCSEEFGCQSEFVDCDDRNACTTDSCNEELGCVNAAITCDDDDPCTENICDQDFGCLFPGCDDGDACTTDSCGPTGCLHTPTSCDDHDACTTDTCDGQGGCAHAPIASCAGPPDLDDFQCYKSQRPSVGLRGVSVVDQFGASTVAIKRARRLCAPASTASGDPGAVDAAGHLTTYTIRQTTPRFVGEKGVKVVNSLGEITVDLIRPERLLVPTAKSLTSAPSPLTDDLDHFKCYRVRGAPFRKKGIAVETQFGPVTVDIKRPRYLCAPASKNGETAGAETHVPHLMCYDVRARTQPAVTVFTNNQFGDDHYDIVGLRELCIASFKNAGPCGNGSVDAPGETCDPPGAVCASDGRVCGSTCTCPAPTCGDGIVNQASEQCDDGDTDSGDGCSATCELETPLCGNDLRQGVEQCDGTDDATCPGACSSCACIVSPANCPADWTVVDDNALGLSFCLLPCGAGNSCPEPFTCDGSGFCVEPCGTSPTCGGECPGNLQCLQLPSSCICGGTV